MAIKIHGIPMPREATKRWAITNLIGFFEIQNISSDSIKNLLSKGYDCPHEDITTEITKLQHDYQTCLRATDPENFTEIITTYDGDADTIDFHYPIIKVVNEPTDDNRLDENTTTRPEPSTRKKPVRKKKSSNDQPSTK